MNRDLHKRNLVQMAVVPLPAVALLVYVVLRARQLSLTWDEAYTFFNFVRHSSWLPHDFNYMSANNHLLNTWLMKCSVALFGESELALRLPNVLAAAFFFFATIKILRLLLEKWWQVFAAVLVVGLDPYLLDFFSLARGYGISIALLTGAIYQLLLFFKHGNKTGNAIRCQLFLAFAVLANLTLLPFTGIVAALLLVYAFREKIPARETLKWLAVPLVLFGMLAFYLFRLQQCGAFFFGDQERSIGGTLKSLQTCFDYGKADPFSGNIIFILAIALPLTMPLLFRFLDPAAEKRQAGIFLLVATLHAFVLPAVQHIFLGTNFLTGRTALFFLPLMSFLFVFAAAALPSRATTVFIFALGGIFLSHFSSVINDHSTFDFREQADVKDAIRLLDEEKAVAPKPFYAAVLCTDLPYDEQVNYYKMRYRLNQFGHVSRNEFLDGATWAYLPVAEGKKHSDWQLVHEFPGTATALFRSKDTVSYSLLVDGWEDFDKYWPVPQIGKGAPFFGKQGTKAGGEGALAFSTLSRIERLDTLSQKPVAVSVYCRLNASTRNTAALLVCQVLTDSDTTWEGMHIAELAEKPGEWSETGWTRPLPPDAKEVRVFLWNESNAIVYMDNVGIRILGRRTDPESAQ